MDEIVDHNAVVQTAIQGAQTNVYELQRQILHEKPLGRFRYYAIPLLGAKSSRETLRTSDLLRRLGWTLSELSDSTSRISFSSPAGLLMSSLQRLDTALSERLSAAREGKIQAEMATNVSLLQIQNDLHGHLLELSDDQRLAFLVGRDLRDGSPTSRIAAQVIGEASVARLIADFDAMCTPEATPENGGNSDRVLVRRKAILALQHVATMCTDEELIRDGREHIRAERHEWIGGHLLWGLIAAIGLFVATTTLASESTSPIYVTGQALTSVTFAMLGGTISIVRDLRIRDSLGSGYKKAVSAQLLASGALGLLSLLLLTVGALPGFQAPGPAGVLATSTIYAFLAGYSEPFIIGVVQGLTGAKHETDVRNG